MQLSESEHGAATPLLIESNTLDIKNRQDRKPLATATAHIANRSLDHRPSNILAESQNVLKYDMFEWAEV